IGYVGILAGANYVLELLERQTRRAPVLIGRQILRGERSELTPAGKILRGVDHLGLTDEGVASGRIVRIRVAVVTSSLRVHDVAAKPNEQTVLAARIQCHRRDVVADSYFPRSRRGKR